MKRFYFFYIFLLIIFVGCGSVSSPSSMNSRSKKPTAIKKTAPKPTDNKIDSQDTLPQNVQNSPNQNIQSNGDKIIKNGTEKKSAIRFADTTTLDLSPIYAQKLDNNKESKKNPINYIDSLYNQAVVFMDEGNTEEAKAIFTTLKQTLLPGDSLYYEANFMEIECIISKNDISNAEILLKKMYNDEKITDQAYEKVLVRLGQIECVKANHGSSQKYFDELKNKYPNSIYLKVANCNFLKQKK